MRREHTIHRLVNVFVMLCPSEHLPPRLPDPITEDVKNVWFAYVRLWSDLRSPEGVEPNEDTLGELWALHLELKALGVWFDPVFCKHMDEVGTLAINIDPDREPEYEGSEEDDDQDHRHGR